MKRFFLFILSLFMIVSLNVNKIYAADSDTTTYTINVTYGQSEARSMLSLVNDLRVSNTGCWDSTNTTKIVDKYQNLKALTYDYELEKVAMERAKEIAIYYSHTRPNGSSCFTAYTGNYSTAGENIAVGQKDAEAVFNAWKEENDNYAGQGHRRNMLSSDYTAIGIGHVYYNGYHYWVQEFRDPTSKEKETDADDTSQNVDVEVLNSYISKKVITPSEKEITLEQGKTTSLPTITAKLLTTESYPKSRQVPLVVNGDWIIGDSSIVSIENGKIVANKVGNTYIQTTIYGEEIKIPISITEISIKEAEVAINDIKYTGVALTPKPVVMCDGKTLIEGTDYTTQYSNNINVGQATITINGIGNYKDSIQKNFTITPNPITNITLDKTELTLKENESYTLTSTIVPSNTSDDKTLSYNTSNSNVINVDSNGNITAKNAGTATITVKSTTNVTAICNVIVEHVWDKTYTIDEDSTCIKKGQKSIHCTICNAINESTIQTIDKKEHTIVIDKAVSKTCETDGLTEGTHCSYCNKVLKEQEVIKAEGHKYDSGTITTPTCTQNGVKIYTCTVCGKDKNESISKLGHDYKTVITFADNGKTATYKAICNNDSTHISSGNCTVTSKVTKIATCTTKGTTTYTATALVDGKTVAATKDVQDIAYIKTIKLSSTSYTYDGKVKTPTLSVTDSNGKTVSTSNYTVQYSSSRKDVGTYNTTITFKGNYSGTKILTYTINPKGTSISKLTAISKGITVNVKKQATQTTGYQVQYSTDKNFKNSVKTTTISKNTTVSTTIKKLTGNKKYYVRVRTYKTLSKKNYYSSWSAVKTITTKK